MTTSFEEQLREQLHATTPGPYAGLDPAVVIGAARRVQRRRPVGQVIVAVLAVAALAIGGSALTGHRLLNQPQPAVSVVPSPSAAIQVPSGAPGSAITTYAVSLTPAAGGRLDVTTWEETTRGFVRLDQGTVPASGGRTTSWEHNGVVLGIVPSHSPGPQLLLTMGPEAVELNLRAPAAVPGTGWSAFAVTSNAFLGGLPPTSVAWFDASGRPVDPDGRVGVVATVDGERVWRTADGAAFGAGSRGAAVAAPVMGDVSSFLRSATSTVDPGLGRSPFDAVGVVKADSDRVTIVFDHGPEQTVDAVALGDRRAFIVRGLIGATLPAVTAVRWTDRAGVSHVVNPRTPSR